MTFGGIWPTAASQGVPLASGAEIYLIFLAAESVGAAISLVQVWERRDGGDGWSPRCTPRQPIACSRVHGLFSRQLPPKSTQPAEPFQG